MTSSADLDAIKADLGLLLGLLPRHRQFGSTWRAPCPVHGGERLSLLVRAGDDGWAWNCFACGIGGDVVNLVMHLEACDFRTALGRLSSGQVMPAVALWKPPARKAWAVPCSARACSSRIETDMPELADVANPGWLFGGDEALCPRCALRLAQALREEEDPGRLVAARPELEAIVAAAWVEELVRRQRGAEAGRVAAA